MSISMSGGYTIAEAPSGYTGRVELVICDPAMAAAYVDGWNPFG